MSDSLLFSAKWDIFQLYHGKNKLHSIFAEFYLKKKSFKKALYKIINLPFIVHNTCCDMQVQNN
jgi:hypothetical protein